MVTLSSNKSISYDWWSIIKIKTKVHIPIRMNISKWVKINHNNSSRAMHVLKLIQIMKKHNLVNWKMILFWGVADTKRPCKHRLGLCIFSIFITRRARVFPENTMNLGHVLGNAVRTTSQLITRRLKTY